MKEKRFNVGDMVTFKSEYECVNVTGKPNKYYRGGGDQGGHVGEIVRYYGYNHEMDCWGIKVNGRIVPYYMLESEFEEYTSEKKTYNGQGIKHKFI